MPQPIEANRELVKSLYIQGVKISIISTQTGVKTKTIQTWSSRYKWGRIASETREAMRETGQKSLAAEIGVDLGKNSDLIRERLSHELLAQTEVLSKSKPESFGELRNTPEGQGRTQVAKVLADTASVVHGWDSLAGAKPLIVVGLLRQFDTPQVEAPTIDVEAA
jgi:hypothetical protein